MTKELIQFAAIVRTLDDDAAYTLWLQAQRWTSKYKDACKPDEANFFKALALLMDARYKEAAAA